MNSTLLINGAIAFAGALLLAWQVYRQERRNKKSWLQSYTATTVLARGRTSGAY